MSRTAVAPSRLLFPALRWDPAHGFAGAAEIVDAGITLGVGGFILFGGEAGAVAELTAELRRRSPHPLLIGADLERGAGQQFQGATSLPPAAALGALDDLEVTRRAGEVTAREAMALGVDWVYAPVADLDIEPRNPIVGTRAFGGAPERVAAHVVAWIEGCRAGGALACVKHFPGHGRTVTDSHVALPEVAAGRGELERDLLPFRAAIGAGVDSVMTAHVAYPALDPSGIPATLSPSILTGLLRESYGYQGLVVTDALIMEGVRGAGGAGEAAVRAVAAGCDALLYPPDPIAVAEALAGEVGHGLAPGRVAEAVGRLDGAVDRTRDAPRGEWGRESDRRWALDVAVRTLRPARAHVALPGGAIELVTVDDDVGGPYPPPSRAVFPAMLRSAGLDLGEAEAERASDRSVVVAVYADIRAWKGRPGLSAAARDRVARAIEDRSDAVVVLFGHPRLMDELPGTAPALIAWGGEALMQEAAARWLTAGGG